LWLSFVGRAAGGGLGDARRRPRPRRRRQRSRRDVGHERRSNATLDAFADAAQRDTDGALPTLYAATQELPGDLLTVRGSVIGLDLADLTFMDSTGVKALCLAMQRLGVDGRIVLFRPRPFVLRVLEIAGLDGTFNVSDEIVPLPT
jgi:hypothetical protein